MKSIFYRFPLLYVGLLMRKMMLGFLILVFMLAGPNQRIFAQGMHGLLLPPFPYDEEEGLFVTVPAITGGMIVGAPVALVSGLICLPAAVIPEGREVVLGCAIMGGMITSVIASAVVGFPFYVVKKVLWDAPKGLVRPLFRTPTEWEIAEKEIERLPPSNFINLPADIRSFLERRDCMIPQPYNAKVARNVIEGDFDGIGKNDWAVLCSKKSKSSILIFWEGSIDRVSEILMIKDIKWLQELENMEIGYSRAISVFKQASLNEMYNEISDPKPPIIENDAILDFFVGKYGYGYYFYDNKWWALRIGTR